MSNPCDVELAKTFQSFGNLFHGMASEYYAIAKKLILRDLEAKGQNSRLFRQFPPFSDTKPHQYDANPNWDKWTGESCCQCCPYMDCEREWHEDVEGLPNTSIVWGCILDPSRDELALHAGESDWIPERGAPGEWCKWTERMHILFRKFTAPSGK